jgi:superoxide dismutase, Fe-Mn family
MVFELPELPYALDALEPHISKETLEFHYGKHHAGYVKKLNVALNDSPYANHSLEEIIQQADGGIFNNAAQIWNHTFYWNSMSPNGGGEPDGALLEAINKSFGSFDDFHQAFNEKAATLFGSGWVWLYKNADNSLGIMGTENANTPLREGKKPLLVCDVWEHAYYIDARNARPDYIKNFWQLINWTFAANNFAQN